MLRVGGGCGRVASQSRVKGALQSGGVDVSRAWWNTRGAVQSASFAPRLEAVVRGFKYPAGRLTALKGVSVEVESGRRQVRQR